MDVARLGGVVPELASQCPDVDVERLGRAEPVLVPDPGHQVLTGDHLAGPAREREQQVELARSQDELPAADRRAPGRAVQLQPADHDRSGPGGGGLAAQVRAQPGEQLGQPERFGQVVVGARVEADHHVQLVGPRGQHDDHRVHRDGPELAAAHRRPVARVEEGQAARAGGATAMIDLSDGLAIDLDRVAAASGVGVALTAVPVADGATAEQALGGGEDYELAFSAADPDAVAAAFRAARLRPPLRVGSCTADPEERRLDGGPLAATGWEHDW